MKSVYLVCEADAAVSAEEQERMALGAGCEVRRCGGGHMAVFSMPEVVGGVVVSAAVGV